MKSKMDKIKDMQTIHERHGEIKKIITELCDKLNTTTDLKEKEKIKVTIDFLVQDLTLLEEESERVKNEIK